MSAGAGLLLWLTYRDVLLWGDTDPQHRAALFGPDASLRRELLDAARGRLPGEACAALELLTSTMRGSEAGDAAQVAYCCHRLAEWAVLVGTPRTAFAMAVAAAAALPEDAGCAIHAGRAARAARMDVAAETWFRRAIGLARRSMDWASYADGWLELGRIHAARVVDSARWSEEVGAAPSTISELDRRVSPSRISSEIQPGRGDAERARHCLVAAARAARRRGLARTRVQAYRELFRVTAAAGAYGLARRYARLALRMRGWDPDQRNSLQQELAALMLRAGDNPRRAMLMLQAVAAGRRTAPEKIETLLLLVQAAGKARDRAGLQRAWLDGINLIRQLGETGDACRWLVRLAGIADRSGERARAGYAARMAYALAVRLEDSALAGEAAALLGHPAGKRTMERPMPDACWTF
ncbi:MAG TPA: hypothetical protein VFQ45_21500 [Longimicrobium sp.]|nr:hypothetical protein [Longimicrobium sp.]